MRPLRHAGRATAVLAALAAVGSCRQVTDAPASRERVPPPSPATAATAATAAPACDADNGGITLPAGFCATVFADGLLGARHVTVRPNGDVYVAIGGSGGAVGLRDTDGDGHADQRVGFGKAGGNGIAWNGTHLFLAENTRVVRYAFKPNKLAPFGSASVVVSGLPAGVEHVSKTIAFGTGTTMYLNFGSASNSCQVSNRSLESPGKDPCPELATRAGIWTGDAARLGQTTANLTRYATGLRNTVALAVHPTGALYGVQMDRDNLYDNWPRLFSAQDDARIPAEELFRIERGADYGWPYCYHDAVLGRKVLAPEYGGNGQVQGRCTAAQLPRLALPAHWAPMAMQFYAGTAFPASYQGGAFVSFHGDYFWGSRPRTDSPGYNVAYVPFVSGVPTGGYTVFASGFAGASATSRQTAVHRPTGLAVAPDGALLIADDVGGRLWRVVYRGP